MLHHRPDAVGHAGSGIAHDKRDIFHMGDSLSGVIMAQNRPTDKLVPFGNNSRGDITGLRSKWRSWRLIWLVGPCCGCAVALAVGLSQS